MYEPGVDPSEPTSESADHVQAGTPEEIALALRRATDMGRDGCTVLVLDEEGVVLETWRRVAGRLVRVTT